MTTLALESSVVDPTARDHAVARFRAQGITLPTFAQLADPSTFPPAVDERLAGVDPDAADPANLWRVHWWNGPDRAARAPLPEHVVLPPELTGVPSPIVVLLGDRFPMIGAHKVLAAYACLVPRVVTGRFDPTVHRAIWPSTGNYARGGVAISRLMGCRGVAVLPEHMSAERFAWLDRWVGDPDDIIRTPGSESNVKEIYDACNTLALDPANVVLNQFCEFSNHLGHRLVTGRALEQVADAVLAGRPGSRVHAFVSASGSAGTLGAGDHLKERYRSDIVAVEALECPTLLSNGFGEHNIQGIGDKHVPLIHNVMNTDVVVAVSDRSTDALDALAGTEAGRQALAARGVDPALVGQLASFGLSSWCNVLAAVKVARRRRLGPDDVLLTVATDGAALYASERAKYLARWHPAGFGRADAEVVLARHLDAVTDDHVLECGRVERDRIFNLGYFTWVEQQGLSVEQFEARRSASFWTGLQALLPAWDALVEDFNDRTGLG